MTSTTVIQDWTVLFDEVISYSGSVSDVFNPGAVNLDNEVLHIEFRQHLVTLDCHGDAPDEMLNFYRNGGATESLETPVYEPVPENSIYFTLAVPFIPLIIKRIRLKDYFKKNPLK